MSVSVVIMLKIILNNVNLSFVLSFIIITAEELGIKSSVPAYFDPNLKREDLLTGVSFASGGSGYDPITPKLVVL